MLSAIRPPNISFDVIISSLRSQTQTREILLSTCISVVCFKEYDFFQWKNILVLMIKLSI